MEMSTISRQIWEMKYRFTDMRTNTAEKSIDATWHRVARALAAPEANPKTWQSRFYQAMQGFRFLPAGRILAGAGTGRDVTLFNCFVMGTIPDDLPAIFEHLKEAALTMQKGGGIGYDFSTLRPQGAPVAGVGTDASGPLSFMDVWDAMCRTIQSAGARRGAMMGTLRCDHPDIEAFIDAKRDPRKLRMFNLSVLVTDSFMEAIQEDQDWPLVFRGQTYRTVRASALWRRLMQATYETAEPGVIFIDRINRANNLAYCEQISATNPCGEQPLPPYGACLLGSVNLARLIVSPYTTDARLDLQTLETIVPVAVRMLDNAIDVSRYPLAAQRHEAVSKRRIGLGVTGLADALMMCGVRYGDDQSIALTRTWLGQIRRLAYLTSTRLAAEKGAFPLYNSEKYLAGSSVRSLEPDVQAAIEANGIRNALLTSIAPTGTISLFADNVSSGIEPIFAAEYQRQILMPDGTKSEQTVQDFAIKSYHAKFGAVEALPDQFIDIARLSPSDHLAIQAAAQEFVDSSISKTINLPQSIRFEDFENVYHSAYELGCKGCTTYRPNNVTGSVLQTPGVLFQPGKCPDCQDTDLIAQDGCETCTRCGYSECA